ncbi:MAG: Gfo/Idh/MocA family oxidoreductase [Firmicutes bacterium]|nr:Gfo/Idh/MocA family oxidoreductase [Candidatus Colimorpha enterica]
MEKKKIRICIIGCGQFARHFIPLLLNHPYVEKVAVCDVDAKRAEEYSGEFGTKVIPSFDDALARKDINAVAIFVPRHLHGPFAIAALKAGKNVYSAVPMASSVDDCREIVKLVKEKDLVYMMGETCIYYPCSMFCKKAYERGDFGKFVYGEAQYHHDLLHFGILRNDMPSLAIPPLYYSTHSVSMLL